MTDPTLPSLFPLSPFSFFFFFSFFFPFPSSFSSPFFSFFLFTFSFFSLSAADGSTKKITVIRGQAYDLTDFISQHPGGHLLVGQAIGRDATYLVESYHVRDDLFKKQLDKLPKVANPGSSWRLAPFPWTLGSIAR